MQNKFKYTGSEHSACGVGFVASRKGRYSHENLKQGLNALRCVEHRGACAADGLSGDGAGVMTDIPFDLFGYEEDTVAVATLFVQSEPGVKRAALHILESTFAMFGLDLLEYRDVPVRTEVLGEAARESLPGIMHAFIRRPERARTMLSFDKRLYTAKQLTRTRLSEKGLEDALFFTSLSAKTIVYKALTQSAALESFYPDLQNSKFKTRFCLFHRRFSTNTTSSWDKAQPFRLIGHNGEINTIAGNRSWAKSREKMIGVEKNEILTREGISDSGSFNEMVESLRYRSSIPNVEDILAICMPPATRDNKYYEFWGRAMEPWDGPALITYANGYTIGARLDRNGFRPCRWMRTADHFFLSSEAGTFLADAGEIQAKGTLFAGRGVTVDLSSGEVFFRDPSSSRENYDAPFDARVYPVPEQIEAISERLDDRRVYFGMTEEDLESVILPMAATGKEPIGSMGDTARLAVLSSEPRSFFDFFYQHFSQVTNPPLDYLREKIVTDLTVHLGKKPNIFEPKELIPPAPAYELQSPFLSLAQMDFLMRGAEDSGATGSGATGSGAKDSKTGRLIPHCIETTFQRSHGVVGFRARLQHIGEEAIRAVRAGHTILILSDRNTGPETVPLPSLLALRRVVNALNDEGLKLNAAVVVDTGEVMSTHHAAALIGFGAQAVCPWLALDTARYEEHRSLATLDADTRERNLLRALDSGLLKVMAKSGISVVRSYQSAKLFSAIGLGPGLMEEYFPGTQSPVGGLELDQIAERAVERTVENSFASAVERAGGGAEAGAGANAGGGGKAGVPATNGALMDHGSDADFASMREEKSLSAPWVPAKSYLFKDHPKGKTGEKHSMGVARSKLIHNLVWESGLDLTDMSLFDAFLKLGAESEPVALRHLFVPKDPEGTTVALSEVAPLSSILKTFGSGAMSFGAISAEAQRDIFLAMREIGGRSNSGEGGENPYYFTDGIGASVKQIASGRFGVTAEYLVTGDEIQIKICQGAKPGEGGQLMGIKVDEAIARARFATPGFDLISPPPLHDIYSIEDLKQLIHDLKQVHPAGKVSVKLVSGVNIGTIAVGVAKAGADIIQISGGEGGTGAASLSSMKHAGLPWEIGLVEAHQALAENGLRSRVILRTDGGLSSGRDLVVASILGAEEFDFGKLLLIAEGCIMARICEKNTCPRGIATHDPKFKAKYKGTKDHVVKLLTFLAEDVRRTLASIGRRSLEEVCGDTRLLAVHDAHLDRIAALNLDLRHFLDAPVHLKDYKRPEDIDASLEDSHSRPEDIDAHPGVVFDPLAHPINPINQRILEDFEVTMADVQAQNESQFKAEYDLANTDRSVGATLYGALAVRKDWAQVHVHLAFRGSAGQSFSVFQTGNVSVRLTGEANDSVCKSMHSGKTVIVPPEGVLYRPEENAIIGNCALYGATGGMLYVYGQAGDRFAVRNSGATAVVEGTGLHACEYMTNGMVVILGETSENVGAGMTGGVLYLAEDPGERINREYLAEDGLTEEDWTSLRLILEDYGRETGSARVAEWGLDWERVRVRMKKFVPVSVSGMG